MFYKKTETFIIVVVSAKSVNKETKRRLKIAAKYSKGKVLDIGFAQLSNPFLKNAVGLDINKVKCPPNYLKVYKGSAEKLPFKKSTFDTITANELIEHLENTGLFLDECNRVLKPGGILIVTTPNPYYPIKIINEYLGRGLNNDSEHIVLFCRKRMRLQFKHHGFKLIKEIGVCFEFPFVDISFPLSKLPVLCTRILYVAKKK